MKSSLCSFLFAALLLFAGAAHRVSGQLDHSNDPARKVVEDQIINAADEGFLSVALQEANAQIAKNPDWNRLILIRSQIHKALKQPGKVVADYSALIGKIPAIEANFSDLARIHVWRADEYLGLADHESALADFAKAITYGNGTFANAFTNHTREHLNKMDSAAAISDHTKVIAKIPANKAVPIYFNRARLNFDYGNIDASIADYTKMMELTPGEMSAPFNLGRILSKKGDFVSAAKVYTTAIQQYKGKDPRGIHEWYNFRAAANFASGNYNSALADYAKSIEIYPQQQKAYMGRVTLRIKRGTGVDHVAAIEDLAILIDQEVKKPTDKQALAGYYRDRGLLLTTIGAAAAGLADLKSAVATAPEDASLYLARAAVYCDQGSMALAKEDEAAVVRLGSKVTKPCTAEAKKTVKLDAPVVKPVVPAVVPAEKTPALPVTAAGWFAKGNQHLDDRDLQEAVDAFTKAIKLKVGYAEAYERRAVAHFAGMGQTEALTDINKAIALDPTNAGFYLTRASFYCFKWEAVESQNDLKLAKRDEAKALQLGGKIDRPCGAQAN